MQVVVISPEGRAPGEIAIVRALFAAGLARLHLRKPAWSEGEVAAWLEALDDGDRARVVVHQHHGLVARLGLGGRHFRDDGRAPARPAPGPGTTSRACHDLDAVRAAIGRFDAVLLGPVFPSISKPGHGDGRSERDLGDALHALAAERDRHAARTAILALGGVTADRVDRCRAAGFDGVAVIGAVWSAPDPVRAFLDLSARARAPSTS